MIELPDALDIDGVTYDVEITLIGGVVFFKIADSEKRGGLFNLAVELDKITDLVNLASTAMETYL